MCYHQSNAAALGETKKELGLLGGCIPADSAHLGAYSEEDVSWRLFRSVLMEEHITSIIEDGQQLSLHQILALNHTESL